MGYSKDVLDHNKSTSDYNATPDHNITSDYNRFLVTVPNENSYAPNRSIGRTSKPALGESKSSAKTYPQHYRIMTSVFWVGEAAGPENDFIDNEDSAWDTRWMEHYGGVDDPDEREGYYPRGFVPMENPFYFALPYSDFDESGRKGNSRIIPWFSDATPEGESNVKNRWIEIRYNDRTCFAQWEDAGPGEYDDVDYVFGQSQPRNTFGVHAGLDVSPAVRDCLGLEGNDYTDWRFVEQVPEGPWREIVTKRGTFWEDS